MGWTYGWSTTCVGRGGGGLAVGGHGHGVPSGGATSTCRPSLCCASPAPPQVTRIDASDPAAVAVSVDGRGVFTARRVIVAVPLGVLQRGAIAFAPDLPEANRAGLAALGSGLLNKVRCGCRARAARG